MYRNYVVLTLKPCISNAPITSCYYVISILVTLNCSGAMKGGYAKLKEKDPKKWYNIHFTSTKCIHFISIEDIHFTSIR